MQKPQYAILRFAKYKGPEIGRIEAHDERTKTEYASNLDIDTSRSRLNFHLVKQFIKSTRLCLLTAKYWISTLKHSVLHNLRNKI